MATHPRSLRARLIVFEPVFGICLARRPSWSLDRVNYGNSDDGDHNLARDGRSWSMLKGDIAARRANKWVSAVNLPPAVPDSPLFLAPTHLALHSHFAVSMAHRK